MGHKIFAQRIFLVEFIFLKYFVKQGQKFKNPLWYPIFAI